MAPKPTFSPDPPSTPILPGAWPATYTSPRPDRLDHVLDFQQRLVNQMDLTSTPSIPSSILTATNSLDSQLTRRTDTSSSIIANTSISTTCTSLSSSEQLATAKLPQLTCTPLENEYRTRIPRHASLSRRPSEQTRFRTQHTVFDSSPPRSRQSLTTTEISPIIFSSPTSSTFPRSKAFRQPSPLHRSSSYEYESSPSWETSFGSDYDDTRMLNPSPSSSPSPITRRHGSLAPRLSITTRTPSIEITPAPMLTSLSLPASPDTSLELDPGELTSPQLLPIDDEATPWTLSLTTASPVLSTVPDLSLSDTCPEEQHVDISFPSPVSSSLPINSPSTIPDIDSEVEYVANSSAAAYATAVVSSAWTPDGPALLPNAQVPMLSAPIELHQRTPHHDLPAYNSESKSSGVFGKMKKFVRKMLRVTQRVGRDRGGDIRVGNTNHPPAIEAFPDVIDIQSHTSAARAYDNLLPSHDTPISPLIPPPPPPGLGIRRPKTRPLLSAHTYSNHTRTRINHNRDGPRVLRRPKSSNSSFAHNNVPKPQSPDLIAVQARPKTLAEIKSRRRLSLPVLSNFTRPSSASARPVNIVTSNRTPRTVSALAFYPRPPPLSSLRSMPMDSPVPSSPFLRSAAMPSNLSPFPNESDGVKKKNRRFSFSALSNLTVSYRDEALRQRNAADSLSR